MNFIHILFFTLLLAHSCHSMAIVDKEHWNNDPDYEKKVKEYRRIFPSISDEDIRQLAYEFLAERPIFAIERNVTSDAQKKKVLTKINDYLTVESLPDKFSMKQMLLDVDELARKMKSQDYLNYVSDENREKIRTGVDSINYDKLPEIFVKNIQKPYKSIRCDLIDFCEEYNSIYGDCADDLKISTVGDFDKRNRLLIERIDKAYDRAKEEQKKIETAKVEIKNLQRRHELLMEIVVKMQKEKRDEIISDALGSDDGSKYQFYRSDGFMSPKEYLECYRDDVDAMNHFIFTYLFKTKSKEYLQSNNPNRDTKFDYETGMIGWKKKNGEYFALKMSDEKRNLAHGLSSLTCGELSQWTGLIERMVNTTGEIVNSGNKLKNVLRLLSSDVSRGNYVPSEGVAVFYGIHHYITYLHDNLKSLPKL